MKENIELFLKRKQAYELLEYYKNSNASIKQMMGNIYKASYRFALDETRTVYLLEEATRPLKAEVDLIMEIL